MQNLEQKVDTMLQNQDDIRRSIIDIQNNAINMMTTQKDILQKQFEMQQDIQRLDKKIEDNYEKLDKKIDDTYDKLNSKIDNNYQKLDEKIDKNAEDTSEILQDICVKLDELSNPKPKLTILK